MKSLSIGKISWIILMLQWFLEVTWSHQKLGHKVIYSGHKCTHQANLYPGNPEFLLEHNLNCANRYPGSIRHVVFTPKTEVTNQSNLTHTPLVLVDRNVIDHRSCEMVWVIAAGRSESSITLALSWDTETATHLLSWLVQSWKDFLHLVQTHTSEVVYSINCDKQIKWFLPNRKFYSNLFFYLSIEN